jgi:hypothetical protein
MREHAEMLMDTAIIADRVVEEKSVVMARRFLIPCTAS